MDTYLRTCGQLHLPAKIAKVELPAEILLVRERELWYVLGVGSFGPATQSLVKPSAQGRPTGALDCEFVVLDVDSERIVANAGEFKKSIGAGKTIVLV